MPAVSGHDEAATSRRSSHRHPLSLSLVVHHDDPDRGDAPYDAGCERLLAAAREHAFTVVSMKDHWATVFSR